jgi:hypothetical protein
MELTRQFHKGDTVHFRRDAQRVPGVITYVMGVRGSSHEGRPEFRYKEPQARVLWSEPGAKLPEWAYLKDLVQCEDDTASPTGERATLSPNREQAIP